MQTQQSHLDAGQNKLTDIARKLWSLPASNPRTPFCDVKAKEAISGIYDSRHVHFSAVSKAEPLISPSAVAEVCSEGNPLSTLSEPCIFMHSNHKALHFPPPSICVSLFITCCRFNTAYNQQHK